MPVFIKCDIDVCGSADLEDVSMDLVTSDEDYISTSKDCAGTFDNDTKQGILESAADSFCVSVGFY